MHVVVEAIDVAGAGNAVAAAAVGAGHAVAQSVASEHAAEGD